MKHKRIWLSGMAAGIVLSMSLTAFAAPLIQEVKAFVRDDYKFIVNGQEVNLPEGYHAMSYENHSYLPVRFLAEQLNADVEYNDTDRTIKITTETDNADGSDTSTPATPPAVTTKPAVETPEKEDGYHYKAFPQTEETGDYIVKAVMFTDDNKNNRLWLKVENKTDSTLRLDQSKTTFIVDGKDYVMELNNAANFDKRWYNDLLKDDEVEGFILMPSKISSPETIHLELHLSLTEPYSGKITEKTVTFDLKVK